MNFTMVFINLGDGRVSRAYTIGRLFSSSNSSKCWDIKYITRTHVWLAHLKVSNRIYRSTDLQSGHFVSREKWNSQNFLLHLVQWTGFSPSSLHWAHVKSWSAFLLKIKFKAYSYSLLCHIYIQIQIVQSRKRSSNF